MILLIDNDLSTAFPISDFIDWSGRVHTDGFEAVFRKINIAGCKTLHIGCVYRQPNNNSEPIYELIE